MILGGFSAISDVYTDYLTCIYNKNICETNHCLASEFQQKYKVPQTKDPPRKDGDSDGT